MALIRADAVAGSISAALSSSATTMESDGLADLPAISGSDFARLTLYRRDLAGRVTAREIVHVTAHTAGATTATILRAQEGTSARTWVVTDRWDHAITAADLDSLITKAAADAAYRPAFVTDAATYGDGVASEATVTAHIQAKIDLAEAAGGGDVVVAKGTYNAEGLVIDSPGVTLIGVPGTVFNGSGGNGITTTAHRTTIKGIKFTGYANALVHGSVDDYHVEGCEFDTNTGRACTYSALGQTIRRVRIIDNHVNSHSGSASAGGFQIGGAVADDVKVLNNHITGLTSTASVNGVSVGENDGTDMTGIVVEGNVIRDVSGAGETHAIIVWGSGVVIRDNYIDTVDTTTGDCEAIYTKATGVVEGNTVRNGGSPSGGGIQIKGVDRGEVGPEGYAMRVRANHVYETRAIGAMGISTFCSEALIEGNWVEGADGPPIHVAVELVKGTTIHNNDIVASRYQAAIEIRNDVETLTITDNRINGIITAAASSIGVWLRVVTNAAVSSDVFIERNKFFDLRDDSASPADRHAVFVAYSVAGSSLTGLIVRDNVSLNATRSLTVSGPENVAGTVIVEGNSGAPVDVSAASIVGAVRRNNDARTTFPTGTAAAPGLALTDALNTGFTQIVANTFSVSLNGSEWVRWDTPASGEVGQWVRFHDGASIVLARLKVGADGTGPGGVGRAVYI